MLRKRARVPRVGKSKYKIRKVSAGASAVGNNTIKMLGGRKKSRIEGFH